MAERRRLGRLSAGISHDADVLDRVADASVGKGALPRKAKEILDFCRPYADFLQKAQNPNGCIPSWFSPDGIPSRAQFRDFNAETASSALFLLEYGDMVQDAAALACGRRALSFVTDQVLPRNRWYDFETFLSCSKKSFGFYDSITAQYPQCNLSAIHAAAAYLVHYRITQRPEDLEQAEAVLDYLLLTQQLWNHPLMHIRLSAALRCRIPTMNGATSGKESAR